MGAIKMLKKYNITTNVYNNALSYLMFLKRKRLGKVKARGCANGRPQREFISKEESSLPTVSIYALIIPCTMDAIKRNEVTCDIHVAFLQAYWSEEIDCHLKFEGVMADMICDIGPSFKDNVIINKKTGKKKLYAKLTKAVRYSPWGNNIQRETKSATERMGI